MFLIYTYFRQKKIKSFLTINYFDEGARRFVYVLSIASNYTVLNCDNFLTPDRLFSNSYVRLLLMIQCLN